MRVAEILKNFHHFYETVLPKAYCSPGHNKESIANAFLWAETCEKLYEKLDDENIKELKKQLQDLRCAKDENLKQCTSILCHAFLQNPHIDKSHLENILSQIKPFGLDQSKVWKDAVELDSLCIQLLESLKFISLIDSDRSFYHEIKSELFLDFLKNFSEQLLAEEQLETCMSLILQTLCGTPDGMKVLLHVLLFDGNEVSEIQEFSAHWVLSKLLENKNGSLANFLWSQPPCNLRRIAVRHPAFYSYYIDYLMQLVSTLQPVPGSVMGQQRQYTTNDKFLSYDEVVQHFKNLLSTDDAVAHTTRDYLERLNKEKDSTIWRDFIFYIGQS